MTIPQFIRLGLSASAIGDAAGAWFTPAWSPTPGTWVQTARRGIGVNLASGFALPRRTGTYAGSIVARSLNNIQDGDYYEAVISDTSSGLPAGNVAARAQGMASSASRLIISGSANTIYSVGDEVTAFYRSNTVDAGAAGHVALGDFFFTLRESF